MSGWPLLSNELAWRLALADVRAARAALAAIESSAAPASPVEVRERGRTSLLLAPALADVAWFNRVVGLCQQNALALGELAGCFARAGLPLRLEVLPCDLTPDLARRMALCGLHHSGFTQLLLGLARAGGPSTARLVPVGELAERLGWPAEAVAGPGWAGLAVDDAAGLLYLDGTVAWLAPVDGGGPAAQAALLEAQSAWAHAHGCEQLTLSVPPLGSRQRLAEAAGLRLVCTQALWTPRPLSATLPS